MHYTTFLLAAVASLAAQSTAATTTASAATGTSTCQAQNILDACIASIQGQINSCAQTDYSCLCLNYGNLVSSCYANCPGDPGVGTAQQQRDQYCSAASVYGSTTTYGHASSTSGSGSATTTDGSSTAIQTGFGTATSSGSGSSTNSASGSSKTSNAAAPLKVGGGLFALLAAGFGVLL